MLCSFVLLVERLTDIEGVVGLTLTPATRQFFDINEEEMVQSEQVFHKWLSWKKIKLHIFMNGEHSEFHPYYNVIKVVPHSMTERYHSLLWDF